MPTCPMCKKGAPPTARECPTCRTDLSILVDYIDHLEDGLTRAAAHTRAGELGDAVWAYLSVLEVDPDNPTARRQVGQVVAAVRQFDRIALGRRWLDKLQRRARFRQWADAWGRPGGLSWPLLAIVFILFLIAGVFLGWSLATRQPDGEAYLPHPAHRLGVPFVEAGRG